MAVWEEFTPHSEAIIYYKNKQIKKGKVHVCLQQVVESHTVVRRRGSYIF
jgi:hypothetical protein